MEIIFRMEGVIRSRSQCAVDEREAYDMLFAGDNLRAALAERGYAPR